MGFLDRFLGQSAPQQTSPSYDLAHREFLLRLSGRTVDKHMAEIWNPHLGSIDRAIARFVKDGVIREATVAERIDAAYRVVDLKPILAQHGLKAKGRKADSISALLAAIPHAEASKLVGNVRVYRATDLGEQVIAEIRAAQETERQTMTEEALSHLRKGDVRQAGKVIARYEAAQLFSRGIGIDWSKGMPGPEVDKATYLLRASYRDLEVPEEQRGEIGPRLALAELLGVSIGDAGKMLLEVTEGCFPCPDLERYLRGKPTGGFTTEHDPESPKDLATLYAHTRMFETIAWLDRTRLTSNKIGEGIKILHNNGDDCSVCHRGKHEFKWSEIDKLPALPRHWGCRCLYLAWI